MMTCSMPAATASSTAYWITGLSTRGSISLGCAFVAGRKRVPQPAAGKTALRTRIETSRAGNRVGPSIPAGPHPALARVGPDMSATRQSRRRRRSGGRRRQASASADASATRPRERPSAGRGSRGAGPDRMTTWRPRRRPRAHGSPPGPNTGSNAPLTIEDRRPQPSPAARGSGGPSERPEGARPRRRPEAAVDDRARDRAAGSGERKNDTFSDLEHPRATDAPSSWRRRGTAPNRGRRAPPSSPRARAPATLSGYASAVVDRDVPAERQAHDDGAARCGLGVDGRGDGQGRGRDRERLVRPRAVSREVDGDAAVRVRQPAQLGQPLRTRQPRPVDEHDRRGAARPAGGPVPLDPGSARPRAWRRGRGCRVGATASSAAARAGRGIRRRRHGISRPCARSPRGPPGSGWRGRACRGCSTRGCAPSAP